MIDVVFKVLDRCAIAAVLVNPQLEVEGLTASAGRLLEVPAAGPGRSLRALERQFDRAGLVEAVQGAIARGEPADYEAVTKQRQCLLLHILPRVMLDDHRQAALITIVDITDSRQSAMSGARAELQREVERVGHDLRQPLQSISLLNSALLQVTGDGEVREILSLQRESVEQMRELIDRLPRT